MSGNVIIMQSLDGAIVSYKLTESRVSSIIQVQTIELSSTIAIAPQVLERGRQLHLLVQPHAASTLLNVSCSLKTLKSPQSTVQSYETPGLTQYSQPVPMHAGSLLIKCGEGRDYSDCKLCDN